MENPDIWNVPERAQALGKERADLDKVVAGIRSIDDGLNGSDELLDLAESEQDEDTANAVVADVDGYSRRVEELEFRRMFSGKLDAANAFVDVQAGAGGTEAQDWAEMLLRMYLRWCEHKGWKTELMEVSAGDVAGIKSATFRVEGDYAYGWLKTEIGVHRLVRKSPFDSDNRRHTSFTSVFVSPEVDDDIDIEINPADLKTDVYRSSGAGGQHVNKTESAVRITHLPTGIVVQSQAERSQHRNRDLAMRILTARVFLYMQEQERKKTQALSANKKDIDFGSQIRSYVLHPYTMVNDHRTETKVGDVYAVLDGQLDEFTDAFLKRKDTP